MIQHAFSKTQTWYSKTWLKRPLKKKTKNWFSRPIIAEHSAILSTFIKLPRPVFKTFVLSIFEWSLKTGFTVFYLLAYPFVHT